MKFGGIYEKQFPGGIVVYELKQSPSKAKSQHFYFTVQVLAVYRAAGDDWWRRGEDPPEFDPTAGAADD